MLEIEEYYRDFSFDDKERTISYMPLIDEEGVLHKFELLDHIILESKEGITIADYYVVIFENSKETEIVRLISKNNFVSLSDQELKEIYEIFKIRCSEIYELV